MTEYLIPLNDWAKYACWVPDKIGKSGVAIRSPQGAVFRIPVRAWKTADRIPASPRGPARRYLLVSNLQRIDDGDGDDDVMDITPALPMPPPIAFHFYTQADTQRRIQEQQTMEMEFEDAERLVWHYAQALAEMSVYLAHRGERQATDGSHFLRTYNSLFSNIEALALVRMFTVLHVVPRIAALSINERAPYIAEGARETFPFALQRYFDVEQAICRLHATQIENKDMLLEMMNNLGSHWEGTTRILHVPFDMALEAGIAPGENVTLQMLAERVIPSIHVREIREHSLDKALVFLDMQELSEERSRMWLLFDDVARMLVIAFSRSPDAYFLEHHAHFQPGTGFPLAYGNMIDQFRERRLVSNGPMVNVDPSAWRPPRDYDQRVRRSIAAGLPDMEDLGTDAPPCLKQVIVRARTGGYLHNPERFAIVTWMVHFQPDATGEDLFHWFTARPRPLDNSDRFLLTTFKTELRYQQKVKGPKDSRHFITCFNIIGSRQTTSDKNSLVCPYADKNVTTAGWDQEKDYVKSCQARCSVEQKRWVYHPTDIWLFKKETI